MRKFFKKLRMLLNDSDNNNKGFTFVELMCASVILALIVAPALQLFLFATKTNSKARTELQANITASSVLESARSFSIYMYDKKCNADYSTTDKKEFTLLAGQYDEDGFKKFMEMDGTNCYEIEFANNDTDFDNYYVIAGKKKNASAFSTKGTIKGTGSYLSTIDDKLQVSGDRCRYAYVIEGIKQSGNTYDAVVMFEKYKYEDLKINDTTSFEEKEVAWLSKYNKNFKITVLVYRAKDRTGDTGNSYIGQDISTKNTALIRVEGSKLDSAKGPEEE